MADATLLYSNVKNLGFDQEYNTFTFSIIITLLRLISDILYSTSYFLFAYGLSFLFFLV